MKSYRLTVDEEISYSVLVYIGAGPAEVMYVLFTFSHLPDAFIQSDLQIRKSN